MSIIPALDANGFPVDPIVEDLPAGMTQAERHAFAVRVMAVEHPHLKHAADIVHPVLGAYA